MTDIVSATTIETKIIFIRDQYVLLDRDLPELYGIETRILTQAVRRNIKRFPDDFMFQINYKEFIDLKSQIVTSSWGGIRKPPLAFTENGVARLSSVLNSDKAIDVNIQIMRVITKLRTKNISLFCPRKDGRGGKSGWFERFNVTAIEYALMLDLLGMNKQDRLVAIVLITNLSG